MTNPRQDALAALAAEHALWLAAQRLAGAARRAGQVACQESLADATHRCPQCGYGFSPDPSDFYDVGGVVSRVYGDTMPDKAVDCPACHRRVWADDLEELT